MSVSIEQIKAAASRLEGVAIKTPLLSSVVLDELLNAEVFIKPECLQHIGAFKFRGAYNRLVQLSSKEREAGVVAFSSGNHAQGIAFAARLLGMPATIVMPADAPQIKLEGTKRQGATIRLYDRATESREDIAAEIARKQGATLVPAFDDIDIIAGQGTCGLELMQQLHEKQLVPGQVLSPCGGGGLLAGVSTAVKSYDSAVKVYGVEPENYDDHFLSFQAGKRVRINPNQATVCDSLMATMPGELTWSINANTVDGFLVVSEAEVFRAISFAARYLKLVIEPGGAVGLAALLAGKLDVSGSVTGLIISGGNIDPQKLQHCLEAYPEPLQS